MSAKDIPSTSGDVRTNATSEALVDPLYYDRPDSNPYDDPNLPPVRRTVVEVTECLDQPDEYFCSIPHCILCVFNEETFTWNEEPIAAGSICLFNPEPGKLIMQMSRRDHIQNLRFEFLHHSAFWLDGTEYLMFKTRKFGICILLCSTKGEVARVHRFFMSLRIGSIEAAKIEDEKYKKQRLSLNMVKKSGISIFNEIFPDVKRDDPKFSEEYLFNNVKNPTTNGKHSNRKPNGNTKVNGRKSPHDANQENKQTRKGVNRKSPCHGDDKEFSNQVMKPLINKSTSADKPILSKVIPESKAVVIDGPDPTVFDLEALKNLKINRPRSMQGPKFLRKC